MANKLYQSVILQMKDATGRTVGVIDTNKTIVCCSELGRIGLPVKAELSSVTAFEPVSLADKTYIALGNASQSDGWLFVDGNDSDAKNYAKLVSVFLANIRQFYDDKHDKTNFIKNVITNNILPGDIYLKARELGISNEVFRVVLLIRVPDNATVSVPEAVSKLFPDKNKDLIIPVSETDTALVKEIKEDIEARDLESLARSIADMLISEHYTKCQIGIGTTVLGVKDLPLSFKNSQIALEVVKVLDTEKTIVTYESLGIARLIYQLPKVICETFLKEIFKKGSISSLDQETLFTIQKFFENNLNVSETSRKLFVHRNTLVYRLEKIKKLTGLDLREFDDAIVFKVALMVKRYLDTKPTMF